MASKKMGVLAEQPAASKMENDYEAEDHARTLTKAGEILSDPKKMNKAMGHLKKQKQAMKSIDDLKAFHQEKYGKASTAPKPGVSDDAETEESAE
jgi:hypothetical protein